ncbi:endonuclease/exonuclease/phosphatase, putative [Trypanosoma equiperdum]|nr:endonuclease/exonuclease/phosphatase, putative [Trypanosoma equiperdum]
MRAAEGDHVAEGAENTTATSPGPGSVRESSKSPKSRSRCHSPRNGRRGDRSKRGSVQHTPPRNSVRDPSAIPKQLDIDAMQVAIATSLPRRLDQFCDEFHSIPFVIRNETFPVPDSLKRNSWIPGEVLRVAYITWNMAHAKPDFYRVSKYCICPNAHLVVVCTQENGCNWYAKKKQQRQWRDHITQACLKNSYELVGCNSLWYIHMLVYARKHDVAPHVGHVEKAKVRTGIGNGLGGNKGGVGIALSISTECRFNALSDPRGHRRGARASKQQRQDISCSHMNPIECGGGDDSLHSALPQPARFTILFVGAHLAAHQDAVGLRNRDYRNIVKMLHVGLRGKFKEFHASIRRSRALACCPLDTESARGLNITEDQATRQNAVCSNGGCKAMNGSAAVSNERDEDDGGPVGIMKLPFCMKNQPQEERRDATDEFDLVFFGGDLNYRLDGTSKAIRDIIDNKKNVRSVLCNNDQLNRERAKGEVFRGFKEGNLFFRPTYKYELRSRNYSTTDKRIPAYCDRVLFKKPAQSCVGKVRIRLYTDVQAVQTSDHRPVVAIFDVATIPSNK